VERALGGGLVYLCLQGDATIWWNLLDYNMIRTLSDKEFEKVFLDRWSRAGKRDTKCTKGLFSCGNSILQVHGCIHKENIIVSINPSCMHNFINVQLVNRLQRMFKAYRLRVKMFKFLKM
jgi:hypothetical protein